MSALFEFKLHVQKEQYPQNSHTPIVINNFADIVDIGHASLGGIDKQDIDIKLAVEAVGTRLLQGDITQDKRCLYCLHWTNIAASCWWL